MTDKPAAPLVTGPLAAMASSADMAGFLDGFDDGVVLIGQSGKIVGANNEACGLIGQDFASIQNRTLADLEDLHPGLLPLANAISRGVNAEFVVRTAGGKTLFAVVRRARRNAPERPPSRTALMIVTLRDLEVFEYRRRKALGNTVKPAFRTLADNKARPDFATQRLIAPQLEKALGRGERAILQGARILITGESGSGKTEIARYFHTFVSDTEDPFQVVNCASIPDSLFESEMFGYEKGAFTGALSSGRAGLIEQAEGGTLFLDEIGEVPLSVQAKLLGFLEDGVVRRIGGGKHRSSHVRVIAATNRDLRQMVREGRFRADLYYRLAVVHLAVPPLRAIPELTAHLIDRFVETLNLRRAQKFSIPGWVRRRLIDYRWPGNVRELLNVVQQLSIFHDENADLDGMLSELLQPISTSQEPQAGEFGPSPLPWSEGEVDLREAVRRFERRIIDRAIEVHGSKRAAARALGVDIGTIVRKTTGAALN